MPSQWSRGGVQDCAHPRWVTLDCADTTSVPPSLSSPQWPTSLSLPAVAGLDMSSCRVWLTRSSWLPQWRNGAMSTTKSYATELALQTIPVLSSCGQSSLCMGDASVRKADAWFKELNMWNACGVMCGVRVGKPPEYVARWAIPMCNCYCC